MNKLTTELMHHGIQGMRWGIRRYQPYGVGYDPRKVRPIRTGTDD